MLACPGAFGVHWPCRLLLQQQNTNQYIACSWEGLIERLDCRKKPILRSHYCCYCIDFQARKELQKLGAVSLPPLSNVIQGFVTHFIAVKDQLWARFETWFWTRFSLVFLGTEWIFLAKDFAGYMCVCVYGLCSGSTERCTSHYLAQNYGKSS